MSNVEKLPVAVIGGGPVGLAAAAHLLARGLSVRLYEAGATVGASLRDWGHVRVFTTWEQNIDAEARRLLESHGWRMPQKDAFPTGEELYRHYLEPLAATPEMAAIVRTGARVTAISRKGLDKVVSAGRETRPFELRVESDDGSSRREWARAVVDASGTWTQQNPLGAGGLPADGESALRERLAYRMPDVLGRERADYAGRRTLVVGAGYSAANALLDLVQLATSNPGTNVIWAVRGINLSRVYGGGAADQLPARGELGWHLRELVENGRLELVKGFAVSAVTVDATDRLIVTGDTEQGPLQLEPVDRIVVATGQRPDHSLTGELRLELDPWLESTRALGPLIDPNIHSCGSVPPHGHRELSHPDQGFYTVGVKSYGRAPTFLLLTGYEQVRSVAAALAGDLAAADDVRLVLPETGICSAQLPSAVLEVSAGCCGGPAPVSADACCIADLEAQDAGQSGCGCKSAA
ncbi:Thioredoxin reductase [Rhizobiales bacterium GAS188]|nr:Thioredoxin reductase [Rhizobiales bacterium GAS188]